jgi:hypothetical protein
VLGLALAAALAGFVGVLKARSSAPNESQAIRIGWLTPMMAAIVVIDLITFWLGAWDLRELVTVTLPTLLFGAGVTSVYFVTASLLFPDSPELWPDLDVWFERHKAQIAGGIVLANVGFTLSYILSGFGTWGSIPIFQFAYVLLMTTLMVTRRRWQSLVVLALILAQLFWGTSGLPIV